MADDLNKLEQAVERDMDLLCPLPAALPRPEFVAQVCAAVVAEAVRAGRHRRLWRFARGGLAAAAVVLMSVEIATRLRPAVRPVLSGESELAAWAAAVDESGARWARLVETGWSSDEPGSYEDAELDETFRSLEQSFEQFESL